MCIRDSLSSSAGTYCAGGQESQGNCKTFGGGGGYTGLFRGATASSSAAILIAGGGGGAAPGDTVGRIVPAFVEKFDAINPVLGSENDQTSEGSFSSAPKPIFATKYFFFLHFFKIYKIHTPSHRSEFKIFAKIRQTSIIFFFKFCKLLQSCLLYTSPSPRDATLSRMPSSA